MKTVGLRTYSISPHEFPITILITASGLPVNRAVIGQPRVTLDGVLIERLVPEVDEDLAAGTLRYRDRPAIHAASAFRPDPDHRLLVHRRRVA